MMKALFTAATGMDAQQTRIAVISNNIANLNTTGFKSSRAEFEDLIYETQQVAGNQAATGLETPTGLQVGSGVKIVGTQNMFTQGTFEQTGNSLDVAIEGKGFLSVTLPDGSTAYTRAGSLSMDSTGKLITQDGFPVQPAITLNTLAQDRTIGLDGTISSRVPPSPTSTQEGQLTIYTFPNEGGLESIGRNLYKDTTASGTAQANIPGQNGAGTLQQGFLESSNVNIADELIKMILAQRAYELNSKVIQTSDQMLSTTSQLK